VVNHQPELWNPSAGIKRSIIYRIGTLGSACVLPSHLPEIKPRAATRSSMQP
jgi:hypothetical protein